MRTQVWVYIVVVVLSVGAGVAIAGVPNSVPQDPTIEVPATTAAPDTAPPLDAEPVVTESASTEPVVTESASTEPVVTEPVVTEPVTTEPSSTDPLGTGSSTSVADDATTTTISIPARRDIDVAVANGAAVGGAATRVSAALEELGYVDVGSVDGDDTVEVTVIFAGEGLQGAADRLAEEIGMEPGLVFPLSAAPTVSGLGPVDIVVYLGRDVVDLSLFA